MNDNYKGVKDFRDMEVWQHCRSLRKDIEQTCSLLPKSEQWRLSDQMVRAARSVTANIAEGFGRYHYKEPIQQFRMARGSLYELLDHLVVALDNNYLSEDQSRAYEQRVESGIKLLNGYVRYLKTRKETDGKTQSTSKRMNQ